MDINISGLHMISFQPEDLCNTLVLGYHRYMTKNNFASLYIGTLHQEKTLTQVTNQDYP